MPSNDLKRGENQRERRQESNFGKRGVYSKRWSTWTFLFQLCFEHNDTFQAAFRRFLAGGDGDRKSVAWTKCLTHATNLFPSLPFPSKGGTSRWDMLKRTPSVQNNSNKNLISHEAVTTCQPKWSHSGSEERKWERPSGGRGAINLLTL